jgi:hypothetical protein
MKWFIGALVGAVLVAGPGSPAGAGGGKDVEAILDRAIQALGGKEKLSKAHRATWKSKGKLDRGFGEEEFTSQTTVDGPRRTRVELESKSKGRRLKDVKVFAGNNVWWRNWAEDAESVGDGDGDEWSDAHRQFIAATILPLKGKGFKLEAAGEEKVGGKPAVSVKVTPPNDDAFKIYFDKGSGLPVKLVMKRTRRDDKDCLHETITTTHETTYRDYKDFGGVKRATRIEIKRDGKFFMDQHITEFRVLSKVDPKLFARPW